MSNALPPSVTRYHQVQRVAASASASASASACTRKEPLPRLEPVPTRAEWDSLVSEREAIMHESGMVSTRCLPMALADTTKAYGARPQAAV